MWRGEDSSDTLIPIFPRVMTTAPQPKLKSLLYNQLSLLGGIVAKRLRIAICHQNCHQFLARFGLPTREVAAKLVRPSWRAPD